MDVSRFPVEFVSHTDAEEFCRKLSAMPEERRAKRRYRLPTEAEWEYACRANAKTYGVFHFGDALTSELANFNGNNPYPQGIPKGIYLERPTPVGSYKPNAFGLYDMHGNVWQWCQDWYDPYETGKQKDPTGPEKGKVRVYRGGSWVYDGWFCRSAQRNWSHAMDQSSLVERRFEAGNRFLAWFEKYTRVVTAFWVKQGEEGRWVLYVASDRFNEGNLGMAYGEVLRIGNEMKDPYFEPFQVKLVGLAEPMARAALEFYLTQPPKIPFYMRDRNFGGVEIDEAYLIKGPTGEYAMPSGREALNHIIDQEASFFQQHGKAPRKLKLPVLLAYDLAKCGRNELGDLSGKVFKDGITVFENEGFHGMAVEIVRDRDAKLELE